MRRAAKAVVILGGFYVAVCAVMFFAQGALLFHPTTLPESERVRLQQTAGVEAVEVEVPGAVLRGHFVPGSGPEPRPTVLYFGGNAEPVWRQVDAKRWLAERGVNLAVVAYRGYDRSTGTLSGAALVRDARAVFDAMAARSDVDPERIIAWGVSLGTGAATRLACARPVAGVILMAPYAILETVAAEQYPWLPVRALFRHPVDSLACAPAAGAPALVLHGLEDRLIPPRHGRLLAERWAGPARWVPLGGVGHDDLGRHPDLRPALERFLDGVL